MTLPNLSGLSRKKTFVKKAQSADVGVGEGNPLSNERGLVPSPVPATPDVIYHPVLQRGLNRLSNRGLSRVQPVPKVRGETAPLCYEPGAFAKKLPRFYTAPDTRFPPGEKVDTFERVQNGDTVCDALRKSEFGWMKSSTSDFGSFYLPYNVTYTGPPKQEAVAQVRIDNYYFSGSLRNQKPPSTLRFEGIQGQEKLVEADVDERHLFMQFEFIPTLVGQVPNMTVNMQNKLLRERAVAFHFSTLRVLFVPEEPATENRLIVKDNSVWIRTMFNCDLIIEFPLMGNRTTESELLVYLMSDSNAFKPLELYSQYQYLPDHEKVIFHYSNSHTLYLRKEPDLQTKEYIKSELRKIDGHPITKRIMGLMEDSKCKWNRDEKTDSPNDALLLLLLIILLSFDAQNDFFHLKRLAAGILRIKEYMVKPVWALFLERDRMLRRAAAYQLGV